MVLTPQSLSNRGRDYEIFVAHARTPMQCRVPRRKVPTMREGMGANSRTARRAKDGWLKAQAQLRFSSWILVNGGMILSFDGSGGDPGLSDANAAADGHRRASTRYMGVLRLLDPQGTSRGTAM